MKQPREQPGVDAQRSRVQEIDGARYRRGTPTQGPYGYSHHQLASAKANIHQNIYK